LEHAVTGHFRDRATDHYRNLGSTGIDPERLLINLPRAPGGLHRTVIPVRPERWQDKAKQRMAQVVREFNYLEGREMGQIDRQNPRIYFDTDGPKNIMGLLKEFLELHFHFEEPMRFKKHLYITPEVMARCQSPSFLKELIERELRQIMHRIERQACPRIEAELRDTQMVMGGFNSIEDITLDRLIPQPVERTIFRGELNSRLNVDNLTVSINPGTQSPDHPPLPVAGVNIQEVRNRAVSDQIQVHFQPGTTYQITPSYTPQVYLNGNLMGTGYGDITVSSATTTDAFNINWGDYATTGTTFTFDGTSTSAYGYFPPSAYVTVAADGQFTVSGGGILKVNPIDAIKHHIRSNLAAPARRSRKALVETVPPNELKARDTLRDMISETDWRRYVTNGFIMTKAPSGRWYQIFNDRRHLAVYENGVKIESICIHSDNVVPPTDHVINMKIMVELDEDAVRKGGNIHRVGTPGLLNGFNQASAELPKTNLVDLFRTSKIA
jgi:hypothetical protein